MNDAASLRGQGALPAAGLGMLWLVWSADGLVSIDFPGRRPFAEGEGPPVVNVPRRYAEPLGGYFEKRALDLSAVPVDLRGTRFQLRVWDALRKIAPGTVRTYGSIAADVGAPRAMRAVGMANAANPLPIVVPCHRVVEAGNRLGGFSAGVALKRWLLEHEGVRVLGDHVLPGQQELF